MAGPGRVAGRAEAGAGPSWAAVETQTGGTSRHKSRPGDFCAGKLRLQGGWTAGRVGMLRAREECRPHPQPRHMHGCQRWETPGGRLVVSGRQPSQGSRGGCREWGIPGAGVVVVGCPPLSLPHPSSPAFNSSQPTWYGGHGQTSGSLGKAQPGGQLGPGATDRRVSSFFYAASAQPWGCLPGRRGEGVGTPSHFPRDRTLPGILRQGGWGTLSLSHKALLSSSKTAPRGPTSGCGRGLVAGRSATSGHPLCSLLTPALGGPSPGGSKGHSSPGVTPKSLARAPTDPETRQRGRET